MSILHAVALTAGAGVVLALRAVSLRGGPHRHRRFWALALVIAALIYVAGSLLAGGRALGLQVAGLVLYTGFALGGELLWPRLVALGWLAHASWDLLGLFSGGWEELQGIVLLDEVRAGFTACVGFWLGGAAVGRRR